ncbi:alpha-E domain-containing protein [Elioraea sp. Yellowstone]|jgi:uncharacterized alpha-E superfamily protein|uniref:alpha-E domain-containing protein n=1 Tax=Elioraea sp. Yellowstone TaxID=2592070 RepID=UPI0011507D7D|nr:alpha-E domain-containing protein [Elioraea sp. Yellowstone]TQF76663.1 alpha-E domain-containing protein [Elioraea sp. Yellowstone]
MHGVASPEAVRRFCLLDRGNPTSIPAAVAAARQNARTLRPLISTGMWQQLDIFHDRIDALAEQDVAADQLSRLCALALRLEDLHAGLEDRRIEEIIAGGLPSSWTGRSAC